MSQLQIDYQAIFEVLSTPCALFDGSLCFIEVNQAYIDTLMRTREKLIGKFIWDVFPEESERQLKLTEIFQSALCGVAMSLEEIQYKVALPEEEGGGVRESWWNVHAAPVPVGDNQPAIFVLRVEDVTAKIEAQQLKDTIASELQHRVGNLLNVVLTIARQTARNTESMDDFLTRFNSRISSLSKTHKALTNGIWDGMTLRQLAEQELEAYAESLGQKINVDGPHLRLTAKETQAVSMALHELAANSAKYGALKQKGGQLRVSWKIIATNGYEIEWLESGLIDVQEPKCLCRN